MISVQEAERLIIENRINLSTEEINIENALGRVLAENLLADRDFPPFDRVTMDGVAIDFQQLEQGKNIFSIEKTVAAGDIQYTLKKSENCVEVMTGAMLPIKTNTVVRYEDIKIQDSKAEIIHNPNAKGVNIHYKGSDRKKDSIIVRKGTKLSAAEIGVAATVGKSKLLVERRLKAVVISTGEELVGIDEMPLPHQIRTSNSYAIRASLEQWGVEAESILLPDNEVIIEEKFIEFLDKFDVLLISGGVSAGKFDFIPKVLEKLNVGKIFHQVAQRPGKPFWFGKSLNNKLIFAFPGNPASTFMCLHRYFKKWLDASYNCESRDKVAILTEDFTFKPPITFFLQVKISLAENGSLLAKPVLGNGSGDLANLVDADAFLELPADKELFKQGEVYKIFIYR